MWRYTGRDRPSFATPPAAGEESVWDYPRPPRLVADPREVVVRQGDVDIARTRRALRVLETASPPTFYLPPGDVRTDLLRPSPGASMCEWKGQARYWSVCAGGRTAAAAAWSYPDPLEEFAALRDHFGFYPGRLDCSVDGQPVRPQPGLFYAGWVTPEIVGPFKGEPGSQSW